MSRYMVSGYAATYVYVEVEAETVEDAKANALELGVRYWESDASLTEPPVSLTVEEVTP